MEVIDLKRKKGKEDRLAWRLWEIAKSTGLSEQFLRKEIAHKRLSAKRAGRTIIVLNCDLLDYLNLKTY